MSSSRRLRPLLLAACLLLGCSGAEPDVAGSDVARARAALTPFKKALFTALSTAMQDGGVETAIEVCQLRAPAITATAAPAGVTLGRTSHRLRNPDNAPPAWVAPRLESYVASPADTTSRAVRIDDTHVGYVEPIRMKALCTTCHGAEIEPSLLARLAEGYPEDEAVGFSEGDFRGLFWVMLPSTSDG